jgi:hypothetical protein
MTASIAGTTALCALLAFWLAYPAWRRNYIDT